MVDGGGLTPYVLVHPLHVQRVVHPFSSLKHVHLQDEHAAIVFLGFLPHVHLVTFVFLDPGIESDGIGTAQS